MFPICWSDQCRSSRWPAKCVLASKEVLRPGLSLRVEFPFITKWLIHSVQWCLKTQNLAWNVQWTLSIHFFGKVCPRFLALIRIVIANTHYSSLCHLFSVVVWQIQIFWEWRFFYIQRTHNIFILRTVQQMTLAEITSRNFEITPRNMLVNYPTRRSFFCHLDPSDSDVLWTCRTINDDTGQHSHFRNSCDILLQVRRPVSNLDWLVIWFQNLDFLYFASSFQSNPRRGKYYWVLFPRAMSMEKDSRVKDTEISIGCSCL